MKEEDKPQPPPPLVKSRDDKPPSPADKTRVSAFHTGEEFELESGTYVSCNWPARRRPERRCNEIAADGRLVKYICPDACAAVAVEKKIGGDDSADDGGDNAKVPTSEYDDGL